MSFSFGSLNKGKFTINTNGFSYKSLADLFNEKGANTVHRIRAVYINTKGKYGDTPVVALDDCFVNLPANTLDAAKAMLANADAVAAINAGAAGFKIRPYHTNRYNKDCLGVDFVDCEPLPF